MSRRDDPVVELGVGGGDELQSLALVIPVYVNVSSSFLTNILNLVNDFPGYLKVVVMRGAYPQQSMRKAVSELLHDDDWQRFLVIEQDMVLPRDGIVKHALHTDDIVGSVYFQHAPPYQINCMFKDGDRERWGHPKPDIVKQMLERKALWKCDVVGLGATSIARRVFEEWPEDVPTFRNEFSAKDRDDGFSSGEVSHDVYFCTTARRLGFSVYLDTSIQCQHLTEGFTTARHYFTAHEEQLAASRIVTPHNQRRMRVVPRIASRA